MARSQPESVFANNSCLFESNFPVDKCAASYGTIWNAFKRVAAPYGRKQQRALFHGTAARVYSLSPADTEDERL